MPIDEGERIAVAVSGRVWYDMDNLRKRGLMRYYDGFYPEISDLGDTDSGTAAGSAVGRSAAAASAGLHCGCR